IYDVVVVHTVLSLHPIRASAVASHAARGTVEHKDDDMILETNLTAIHAVFSVAK
ncbi:hypothetical protein AOQ84DRAFT_253710, partial [Glonium stellatum]